MPSGKPGKFSTSVVVISCPPRTPPATTDGSSAAAVTGGGGVGSGPASASVQARRSQPAGRPATVAPAAPTGGEALKHKGPQVCAGGVDGGGVAGGAAANDDHVLHLGGAVARGSSPQAQRQAPLHAAGGGGGSGSAQRAAAPHGTTRIAALQVGACRRSRPAGRRTAGARRRHGDCCSGGHSACSCVSRQGWESRSVHSNAGGGRFGWGLDGGIGAGAAAAHSPGSRLRQSPHSGSLSAQRWSH